MGLLTPLAVRIGAIPWMPKLLPQIVWCDRRLHRLSGGRLTVLDLAGLPNLNLTVVGRKSGTPRTTPLLCAPDGDGWLIAGSYFGGPKEPSWVANLRVAGQAEVDADNVRTTVTAHELEGPDRDRAWLVLVDVWPNFTRYEQRTHRRIPVFELRRLP